jgi:nitrate/nitrite-specific signal transduction histidine kinase
VPLKPGAEKALAGSYLDYVIVNGTDTISDAGVRLRHGQNDVQFRFSTPAFYDPESITFHCRLKGVDENWQAMPAGERTLHYAALPPGDYQFELYATGRDGMQQQEPIRFGFTIEKPWWQTLWFLVLANGLLVTIIYALIQARLRQKLRLELMRRDISHDLHDDIGATLSSVNLYADLAQSEKQNDAYLQHIKDNVNHAISHLDDLVWSINPKNDTTEQFIQRLKDYAIPLLKAAHLQCYFEYDAVLLQRRLDLQTKRHLHLLFKEMVNNVAKHAHGTQCKIFLQYQHGHLQLTVEDDGKGFEPATMMGTRNGMASMQERARKLRGEIDISSTLQKGSRVWVKIPV